MQATAIAQAHLDHVAAIVMAEDWAAYTTVISRPFLLVTQTSTLSFANPEDLRGLFQDFMLMLRTQRVTDYIRLVDTAQMIDDHLISARYATHLLSGGQRVMDPVRSGITLRLEGGRWRAASITNSVLTSRWPLLMPSQSRDTAAPDLSVKGTDHD